MVDDDRVTCGGGRRQVAEAEFGELGTWHEASDGGAVVFVVEGELDMSNTAQLEHALRAWVGARPSPSPVIVDLAGVLFCDSTGLSTLLRIRDVEPRLVLRRPSHAVLRVLEITTPGYFRIEV